jgi:hypothetical protein
MSAKCQKRTIVPGALGNEASADTRPNGRDLTAVHIEQMPLSIIAPESFE